MVLSMASISMPNSFGLPATPSNLNMFTPGEWNRMKTAEEQLIFDETLDEDNVYRTRIEMLLEDFNTFKVSIEWGWDYDDSGLAHK